jgi:hypothetical protein
MTVPASGPDFGDKEAARQWMRARSGGRASGTKPATPEEFTARQQSRLIHSLGVDGPAQAGPRRILNVALYGESIVGHTVRLDVLGPFLAEFQQSVTSVAQALEGDPTAAAPIPRRIQEATLLSAAATFPSSFGVSLVSPVAAEDILFPGLDEMSTILDDAITEVLDIVDLAEASGESDDAIVERLVQLRQRSLRHLGLMTKTLADAAVGVKIHWNSSRGYLRSSNLTPTAARRVREICDGSAYGEPETITVTGLLGGANSFRGAVEIRTDARQVIKARTADAVTLALADHYGRRVEAEIEVVAVRFAGGREREIFTVTALRNTTD